MGKNIIKNLTTFNMKISKEDKEELRKKAKESPLKDMSKYVLFKCLNKKYE